MFHSIDLHHWTPEIFSLLPERTPLLTAGTPERCNTMTIGWAGLGTLWGKPVCTVYVRPQRYTRAFLDSSAYFSVAILPESQKEALHYCGTKSGRDGDKFSACGLSPAYTEQGVPYPAQAEKVLICRKLYCQPMQPECFCEEELEKFYPGKDYHLQYIGEVVEVLSK